MSVEVCGRGGEASLIYLQPDENSDPVAEVENGVRLSRTGGANPEDHEGFSEISLAILDVDYTLSEQGVPERTGYISSAVLGEGWCRNRTSRTRSNLYTARFYYSPVAAAHPIARWNAIVKPWSARIAARGGDAVINVNHAIF